MALKLSTGAKNYALNSGLATAWDTNGRINIYTGSQPTNGGDAATGTLLATLTLSSDAFGAASGGVITANSITSDTSADATGTAGYFILYNSTETAPGSAAGSTDKRITGTVTATGGGGDMTFDSISFTSGGTVALTSLTITQPG